MFAAARVAAGLWRERALALSGGDGRAPALLEAAKTLTTLVPCAVADDDACLCGAEAVLDRQAMAIFYKASTATALAHMHIAHELGHFWIDGDAAQCDAAALGLVSEEALPFGAARVESYGPKERRECQANVFARSFLLPEADARQLWTGGENASQIADRLQLPMALVTQQLARGLLLPPAAAGAAPAAAPHVTPPLDASQALAANVTIGPLLLEAGPGTGKTRTLVARVEKLIERGVDPNQILILTYSNKAAEELRERIGRVAGEAATQIWAGTFHAFGLDLLRKFGDRLGLSSHPKIVDLNDQLGLLEAMLPSLPLDHYLTLHEPTQALGDILKVISRAKDELVTPDGFRALADRMPETDDDQRVAKEKAQEVAAIYAAYDAALKASGKLDFGDLIMRCCTLLSAHDDVEAYLRNRFPHILVDEFQDVNRASAVLLKGLAGTGAGLWVVGDARQSIYRFRGASPENIDLFEQDYPTARRLALAINYRSTQPIVDAFAAFANDPDWNAAGPALSWTASAGAGAPITFDVATTLDAEAEGIAAIIARHHDAGVAYRDQAILCRSHTNLARFAAALEARNIPVLYLGDIFERPEIRDLLSMLSLLGEAGSSGLVRVAALPSYGVPLTDLRALLDHSNSAGISQRESLDQLGEATMSAAGLAGFERLRHELPPFSRGQTALGALNHYLFEGSRHLSDIAANGSVAGLQRRLAIYQLLQVAMSYAQSEPRGGIGGFLDWIRRLELFGEERQLRTPPAAAAGIDAVRLMTVHASKGLEFRTVYLPALATSVFPLSRRYDPCPPPPGLTAKTADEIRIEEERCLFFVALSRARETLHLSRAASYGVNRSASPFLQPLARLLPRRPDAAPNWTSASIPAVSLAAIAALGDARANHRAEDLDQYRRCGRAYLYQRILGLNGGREDNGYVRFHRAVYGVLRIIGELAKAADPRAAAQAALDDNWARIGPVDHPYESIYRRQAELILDRAVSRWLHASAELAEWHVSIGAARVRVRPDMIVRVDGGIQVQRLRTGRKPKTKPDDDIYALYHLGARSAGLQGAIGVHFLGSDLGVAVPMSDTVLGNRIEKYRLAIDGIARGHFPAETDDRRCPRCPQYFICASPIA